MEAAFKFIIFHILNFFQIIKQNYMQNISQESYKVHENQKKNVKWTQQNSGKSLVDRSGKLSNKNREEKFMPTNFQNKLRVQAQDKSYNGWQEYRIK